MDFYREMAELIGRIVDSAGVLVIFAGALFASARVLGHHPAADRYRTFRQHLGRAILLGLEFLIAGDIIRTVAAAPTLQSLLVLGLIVALRTFLSVSLQLEVEGRWPWQRSEATRSQAE
jgi:uncharacterized membrane protein